MTDACIADVRADDSFSRVAKSAAYAEDLPTEECDKHVLVEMCSCGGVANEYCKLFAEVDETVKIEEKSLVKLTQEEVDEIYKAGSYGLTAKYLGNEWVYLVNEDGTDGVFKGMNGKLVQSEDAPYVICPEHNQETWEEFQATLPEPTEPETSEDDSFWPDFSFWF